MIKSIEEYGFVIYMTEDQFIRNAQFPINF